MDDWEKACVPRPKEANCGLEHTSRLLITICCLPAALLFSNKPIGMPGPIALPPCGGCEALSAQLHAFEQRFNAVTSDLSAKIDTLVVVVDKQQVSLAQQEALLAQQKVVLSFTVEDKARIGAAAGFKDIFIKHAAILQPLLNHHNAAQHFNGMSVVCTRRTRRPRMPAAHSVLCFHCSFMSGAMHVNTGEQVYGALRFLHRQDDASRAVLTLVLDAFAADAAVQADMHAPLTALSSVATGNVFVTALDLTVDRDQASHVVPSSSCLRAITRFLSDEAIPAKTLACLRALVQQRVATAVSERFLAGQNATFFQSSILARLVCVRLLIVLTRDNAP